MSRLVSRVIEAARDRHPSFTPTAHPPGVLYRRLADWCSEMQGRILAIDPATSGFEQTLTYTLPLSDFDAGLNLGSNRIVTDVILVDTNTVPIPHSYRIDLISRDQRFAINGPSRAAWQEGNILYLRGPSERWLNVQGTIQVQTIVPFGDTQADTLLSPAAVLPLPDAFGGAASVCLAAFMAGRGGVQINENPDAAEQKALDDYASRNMVREFFTADVWRP